MRRDPFGRNNTHLSHQYREALKTIAELNGKLPYRLLKVIYWSFLLIIIVSIGYLSFEERTNYISDYTKTRIVCEKGDFKDIEKERYGIDTAERANVLSEQSKRIAREICGSSEELGYTAGQVLRKLRSDRDFLEENNIFTASFSVMDESFDYLGFAYDLLRGIIVIGVSTELLRRTLYYVLLGAFRPKN